LGDVLRKTHVSFLRTPLLPVFPSARKAGGEGLFDYSILQFRYVGRCLIN
jgi:hypothetical protein